MIEIRLRFMRLKIVVANVFLEDVRPCEAINLGKLAVCIGLSALFPSVI